jgi:anti-sigma regulatory factor (Ser/Thr protein kinase)
VGGKRSKSRRDAVKTNPATIRLQLGGRLEDRNVALEAVSEACKLVTAAPRGPAWSRFRSQVISAVGEGFNNVVLHGKVERKEGSIDLRIRTRRGLIRIELRDWGPGFDPSTARQPVIEALPESGMGLHIMQSFMAMSYRTGRPNLLILSKRFEERQGAARGKKRDLRVATARAVGT